MPSLPHGTSAYRHNQQILHQAGLNDSGEAEHHHLIRHELTPALNSFWRRCNSGDLPHIACSHTHY